MSGKGVRMACVSGECVCERNSIYHGVESLGGRKRGGHRVDRQTDRQTDREQE